MGELETNGQPQVIGTSRARQRFFKDCRIGGQNCRKFCNSQIFFMTGAINPLTPNGPYRGRTALLTSKSCILYIYSTNIGTKYFNRGIYSPFFPSKCNMFHNYNVFGSCIIHILYTGCAKIKKKIIPAPKG